VVEGRNDRFDLEKNFLLITKKKNLSIIGKTEKGLSSNFTSLLRHKTLIKNHFSKIFLLLTSQHNRINKNNIFIFVIYDQTYVYLSGKIRRSFSTEKHNNIFTFNH